LIREVRADTFQSYEFSPRDLPMLATLLGLLILDSFVLIAAILLQAGKGSGMAASFGGVSSSPDAFIGTRQAGTWLTKITWWAGGIFMGIAFVLQIASARGRTPKSVLEQGLTPAPAAPAQAPSSNAPALPFLPGQATPAPGAQNPAPSGAGAAPNPAPSPAQKAPAGKQAPAAPTPAPK
jgi:preprotein translocase subunit SecG